MLPSSRQRAIVLATTYKYPGCPQPPDQAPGPGRPPGYCADPAHNKVSAWRERRRLAAAETGAVTTAADSGQPVTMARISGAELLRQMRDLGDRLAGIAGQLTSTAATLADPTAAEAEVESARTAAEQRAATAEARAAAAEMWAVTAKQGQDAADEAAQEMSAQLAAAEDRAREAAEQLAAATARTPPAWTRPAPTPGLKSQQPGPKLTPVPSRPPGTPRTPSSVHAPTPRHVLPPPRLNGTPPSPEHAQL